MTLLLAFIGCGDIAGYMAWFARLNRRIAITGCCDRSEDSAATFAARHRIPFYTTDYHDLLAHSPVDAVYIATPHHLHDQMLRDALIAGKHILIEKPITRTLDEALALLPIIEASGLKVGVNYQYRYDRAAYALARAVQAGALGRVHYARASLPWHRDPAYFSNSSWHARIDQAGGGTLLTQGSHLLDLLIWAMGSTPVSARAETARRIFTEVEVEDLALGIVKLQNGALIEIASSMVSRPGAALQIEIYGEHGTATYTDQPTPRLRWRDAKPRIERPPVPGIHALMRSLEGFRRWVEDDIPYLIPASEAVPALAAVDALYTSAREAGAPIRLP